MRLRGLGKCLSIILSGALLWLSAAGDNRAETFSDPGFGSEVVATVAPFSLVGMAWAPDGRFSGAYMDAGTGLANTGEHSFTSPGVNSAGENAWVLVLQVATRFDFDANGKSDILRRNASTGENYIFFINNTTLLGTSGYMTSVATSWSVSWGR